MTNFCKVICFIFISTISIAQKQNNQWRFGDGGGINFNILPPVNAQDAAIITGEGSASIADRSTGELLFYTNGVSVWNSLNQLMPNGANLFGGSSQLLSSTSAAVIIPDPGNTELYYIVTIDEQTSNNGIRYSIVDMSLNNGLGDVVPGQKNIFLFDTSSEKLHVVPISDGLGYWLVSHNSPGNSFYSFKVTSTGIQNIPIVSTIGGVQGNGAGHIKINKQFNKIALGNIFDSTIELFDFDNTTGIISNPVIWKFNFPNALVYGVEFSPNGKVLYVSNFERVIQYDISLSGAINIENSAYQVSSGTYQAGALQLGPNNKIYINAGSIDAISCPNNLGPFCNLQRNVIANQSGGGGYGLPQWIYYYDDSISLASNSILYVDTCLGNATQFRLENIEGNTNIEWDFGDPNSGPNNSANGPIVNHTFTDAGLYDVRAIIRNECDSDTLFLLNILIEDCDDIETSITGIKISGDTCSSLTLDLQVIGTSSSAYFFWNFGDPNSGINDTLTITGNSLSAFPTHTFSSAGLYTVCVNFQEPGLAVSTVCRTISIGLCCTGIISAIDICVENNIPFSIASGEPISSVSWNFGDPQSAGDNFSSALNPTHKFSTTGVFTISAIVNFPCGSDTLIFTTAIVNCDTITESCQFFIPTAFSPNTDGINDEVSPFTNCEFEEYEFSIFNRWGGLLYDSSNPLDKWDGKFKGVECPVGEYIYSMTYKFPFQQTAKATGSLTLLR
ncbi:MAG: gliding motility-associated C-terminal domain-containing protein [Saprospiraceae bacterium]|nr:gliding motility-associated C-terminal domain-containing protein [Saprospiraceae bacterium]